MSLFKNMKKKNIIFCHPCFEKMKKYLAIWQFSTHPRYVRVCGKLPNLLNLASVSQKIVPGNISDAAGLPQSYLCISEWSNFGSRPKIGIYCHLIFYLLSFLPTVTTLATPCCEQYTVSEKSILSRNGDTLSPVELIV